MVVYLAQSDPVCVLSPYLDLHPVSRCLLLLRFLWKDSPRPSPSMPRNSAQDMGIETMLVVLLHVAPLVGPIAGYQY